MKNLGFREEFKKKNIFFFGGGGVRMDVNEELKFL